MTEYCGQYIPTEYSELKKQFANVELFTGDFNDEIIERFKPGSPYSNVTNSPSELPMESPTE